MTNSPTTTQDRQEQLQLAALGWMHRHQFQYRGRDRLLCAGAARYLMDNLDASQEAAENAVIKAYGELRHQGDACYLDISLSSGSVAAIRDPQSGMIYALPVQTIVDRFIPTHQNSRRVYLVEATTH